VFVCLLQHRTDKQQKKSEQKKGKKKKKKRSRILQENEYKISYTLGDGYVGRNM
jgi:hypothetical protein